MALPGTLYLSWGWKPLDSEDVLMEERTLYWPIEGAP